MGTEIPALTQIANHHMSNLLEQNPTKREDIPQQGISICIVSHAGYGAISGGRSGHIGGVERQTSLLAMWLVARGHMVSFITWDEGGGAEEMIHGVRVIKLCRKNAGLPGLRFVHPKWTSLNRALAVANADVYYQNCGGCVTGQMAIWCHRHHKPLVFSVAHDSHCDPEFKEMPTFRERTLYRCGLRGATRRIAQTELQKKMLIDGFGLASEVIPMPAPGPSDESYQPPLAANRRVLWVARVCRIKRPDRLLEIARACPGLEFVIAGPVYDDAWSRRVAEKAKTIPNVRLLGGVPREEITELYRTSSLLCCTSDGEGFPNTFLEAWSHGLPIVSTFDPDSVIQNDGLGHFGTDVQSLAEGIRELLSDPDRYSTISKKARARYQMHHSMESVMPRFEQVFCDLAGSD